MNIFEDLKLRGLIGQCTNENMAEDMLNNKSVSFYIGFDATADSLHIGHFLQLITIARLQKCGHRAIILLGGGTTLVGDPTGKTDMRKMLTKEEISENVDHFKSQISNLINIDNVEFVNNADWLCNLNYLEFLRDIGVHFSVNRMLAAECFKSRYERGLSFIEFNYMIMQSYDFLKLYDTKNCKVQLGGNDQWANILGGVDLIRRVKGEEALGLTFTLLTTKDGKKMGKTEKGAIWLDPLKTSPYNFFQYWRNINDSDVINCLKMLTFLDINEIIAYEKSEIDINKLKEILAFELTKQVHSEEAAQKALSASKNAFGGGFDTTNLPCVVLKHENFNENDMMNIVDMLFFCGIATSKSEARKLITQGGVSIDGEKIEDIAYAISKSHIKQKGEIIIKKGKKTYLKVVI